MIEKDKLITLYAVIKLDNPDVYFIYKNEQNAVSTRDTLNAKSLKEQGTNLWEVFVLQCRVEDMRRIVE